MSNTRADPSSASQRAGIKLEVHQEVEENLGRVIGLQAEAIHGDVYGGDFYDVQVYVLNDPTDPARWSRFVETDTPPYKGLAAYGARDREIFKGRDAKIDEVLRRVREQNLLVIHGEAGMGKTSLLAAGVIPELMGQGAIVVSVQDYLDPARAIRAALSAHGSSIHVVLSEDAGLPVIVQEVVAAAPGRPVVLVFDQLERLFEPPVEGRQCEALLDVLAESIDAVPSGSLYVLLAIQEGALGLLASMQTRLPGLMQRSVQVDGLDAEGARTAIEEPLRVLNSRVAFADGLVSDRLIPDLCEMTPGGEIQPAHLQIVCAWLYDEARGRRPSLVDAQLYAELKGADGIVARYIEETLHIRLADAEPLARHILATLASPGVGPWAAATRLTPEGSTSEQTDGVLERLLDAELLTRRTAGGQREYAFANRIVARQVLGFVGPEVERRYRAEAELERVWSAWLARDTLATRGQLRYLAASGVQLEPQPAQAVLLLRSAVARDEPTAPWLAHLRSPEGRALVRQLEEPGSDPPGHPSSASALDKARQLLAVPGAGTAKSAQVDKNGPGGPIIWNAVNHPKPEVRQVNAVALAAVYGNEAPDYLDRALKASPGRLRRRTELRGVLAEGDPDLTGSFRDLSPLDRLAVWWWLARRRLFRDRHRIIRLTVGGALGAGLALGLLRAGMSVGIRGVGPLMMHSNIAFYFGVILGGVLALGIALAEPLVPQRQEGLGSPPSARSARSASLLAVIFGGIGFGLANVLVAAISGVNPKSLLVAPLGFVAGLGLTASLYGLPDAGRWPSRWQWIGRMGIAALTLVAVQTVFIIAELLKWRDIVAELLKWKRRSGLGVGIVISWSKQLNDGLWGQFVAGLWPREWLGPLTITHVLRLLDAALGGALLYCGLATGLILAARWLARWRALVDRAYD